MFNRKIAWALGLVALIAAPVMAAYYPNFPQVGSASYCGGYSTGTTGQVCSVTVPAGPTILSGTETMLMDTHTAGGVQPQTVQVGLASINALPLAYYSGSTTANNAISPTASTGGVIVVGSAALSPTTVQLPSSPIDGQQYRITANQTIASLTVNSADATVSNAPTVLTVSTTGPFGYNYRYRSSTTTWYRVQ